MPRGTHHQPLRSAGRLLVKELGAFGIVGVICFLIDIGLFQLLYASAGLGAVTAKLLATLVSMSVAFLGHRFWSFSQRARTGLRREYLLFLAINVSTLLMALAIVAVVRYPLGQESSLVLQAANVASIAVGTVIRFLCYRLWVFPASEPADPVVDSPAPPPSPVPAAER